MGSVAHGVYLQLTTSPRSVGKFGWLIPKFMNQLDTAMALLVYLDIGSTCSCTMMRTSTLSNSTSQDAKARSPGLKASDDSSIRGPIGIPLDVRIFELRGKLLPMTAGMLWYLCSAEASLRVSAPTKLDVARRTLK